MRVRDAGVGFFIRASQLKSESYGIDRKLDVLNKVDRVSFCGQ